MMKILYSAGNTFGASHQLANFLSHTQHQVQIAAYPRSGKLVPNYSWNLAAANNHLSQLKNDIELYDPDCVVIDGEPIVANIAHQLSLPILYCSSLHAFDGIVWKRGQLSYYKTLDAYRKMLNQLPPGVCRLVYSPLSLISTRPTLREGFEWIAPYRSQIKIKTGQVRTDDEERALKLVTVLPKKVSSILLSGETQYLIEAMLDNEKIVISPDVNDPEMTINAIICSQFNIASDIGQIELMGNYSTEYIQKISESTKRDYAVDCDLQQLHERIDSLWECTQPST